MKLIPLILAVLLFLIQGPLWFGRGGVLDTFELTKKVQINGSKNAHLLARNDKLRAEVEDLRTGTSAIEERARRNLGMIKNGEVFVQLTSSAVANETEVSEKPNTGELAR